MNIFPNPTTIHEEFSIEINGINQNNQKVELRIFNSIGAQVYQSSTITKEENRFVIKPEIDLPKGVYFVSAEIDETILRRKFVVE